MTRKSVNVKKKKQTKLKQAKKSPVKTSKKPSIKKKVLVKRYRCNGNKKKPINNGKKKGVIRNAKGQIVTGSKSNSPGRPKGTTDKLGKLLTAVARVESKLNKNLLDHFITRAFKSDTVLIAVMKKMHPDLKSIEQVTFAADVTSDAEATKWREEFRERFRSGDNGSDKCEIE